MGSADNAVFLVGASGHAKVIIDIIEREKKHQIRYIIDDNPDLKGKVVWGYQVRGGREEIVSEHDGPWQAVVAVGDNSARRMLADWLRASRIRLMSAVHPSAQIGRDVIIGAGTVIMANVVINPSSIIGENVILNTGVSVDHDCHVAEDVHIAPGSTLCGSVSVGAGAFIGAGSTVIQNISIGAGAFVGAGSVITRDVPEKAKVVGNRIDRC
jgi:sugar O-acyltransferase (sialic acid O-acetyltransferase NeuD family)